jgi:hypothetical protein
VTLLGITIPKKLTDIDDMYIMINQIPSGKTNRGRTLYGIQAQGCPTVLHCWAWYRFDCTIEFTEFTSHDWIQRGNWFDVKVSVDVQGTILKKEMSKDTYGKRIASVLFR